MQSAYSERFKNKLREVYSSNQELHAIAEEGRVFLGSYLDNPEGGISPKEILTAKSLKALQERAKRIQDKKDLYIMWKYEVKR